MSPVRIAPASIGLILPRCLRPGYGLAALCAVPCFRCVGSRSPLAPGPLPLRRSRLNPRRRSFRGWSAPALSRPGPRRLWRNLLGSSRPHPAWRSLRPAPLQRRHPPRPLVPPVSRGPRLRPGAARRRCPHPQLQHRPPRQRALDRCRWPRPQPQGRPGLLRLLPVPRPACHRGLPPPLEAVRLTHFSPRIPRSRPGGSPGR